LSQCYGIGLVSGHTGRRYVGVYHVKHAVALVKREELDLSCNTGLPSATTYRSASWNVMSTQSVRSTPPLCVPCIAGEIKHSSTLCALCCRRDQVPPTSTSSSAQEPAAGTQGGRLDDQTKINQRISPHQHQLGPEETQAYFIFLFFYFLFPMFLLFPLTKLDLCLGQ
jgi:hypothetical protein